MPCELIHSLKSHIYEELKVLGFSHPWYLEASLQSASFSLNFTVAPLSACRHWMCWTCKSQWHKKNSNKVSKPANKHIHRLSNIRRFLGPSSCILHGFRNTEDYIKFQPPSCCFSVSLDLNQTLQHTTYCLSERFPARAICKLKLCITTLLQDGKEIKRLATNHHLLEQSHVGQSLPLGLRILSNRPWEHWGRGQDLHTPTSVNGNGGYSVLTQSWASLRFDCFIPQWSQVLLRNQS